MKKILKSFIIIIVFLMFINVKASTTFTNTPKFVNDYIKNFPNYQRYIVTENKDYGFLSGNIQSGISGFKNGGLLNIDEYKISKSRGNNTYLFNGLEFFTMTFDGGKIQVIDPNSNNGISQKNENEASGIRVTNYVQNGVKLEGRGTLVDPWKFIARYNLQFYYDDTKITIKPSNVMVPESGNVTVDIIPSSTYRYASDDCGGIFNNDKLTVNNISSDMICTVEAGLREFEVTVDANEGIVTNANGWDLNIDLKSATKKIIYNSKIGTLPIVERTGYNFAGWYTDAEGGTPVDGNTIVKSALNIYAHWDAKEYTLTYSNNGGGGCTSKKARYDSTWGNLCTPTNLGYAFVEWNTKIDGTGTTVLSSTIVKGDLTVYAQWKAEKPTTNHCLNPTYNGEEQIIVSTPSIGFTWLPGNKAIEAGNYTLKAKLADGYMWSDGTKNDFSLTCSMGKKPITVKASNQSKEYDGSALNADSTCEVTSGSLVSGHSLECTTSGSQTDAGSSAKTLSTVKVMNGSTDVSANYTITKQNGTLTVTPANSTCPTVTEYSGTYDGNGHKVTVSGGIGGTIKYEKSTDGGTTYTDQGTTNPARVSAGTTYVRVRIEGDSNHNDKTCDTKTVTIAKKAVTIKASDQSKIYDGSALNADSTCEVTSGSLVSGHTMTCTSTGSQTEAGSSTKTLSTAKIMSGSTDVSSNYTITKANGTLTITKMDPTCPTVTAYSGTYDGSSHNVTVSGGSGGTIKYEKSTDGGSTYIDQGTTNPTRVSAGTTYVRVRIEGDSSHSNKTCDTKTVTIAKKAVTIKASDQSKTYDGTALYANTTCKVSSGSVVSGHTLSCTCSGSQIEAGNSTKALSTAKVMSGGTDVSSNYTITKANGTLSVAKATPTLSLNSSSGTLTYGSNATSTITTNSDGKLSCSSNASSTATCGVSGKILTITPAAVTSDGGKATITVSLASTNNYNSASASYTATVNRKSLACPDKPADKDYTGGSQPSGITCPDGSTTGGTTLATAVGTYTQTCTAKSGYKFTSACSVNWKIVDPYICCMTTGFHSAAIYNWTLKSSCIGTVMSIPQSKCTNDPVVNCSAGSYPATESSCKTCTAGYYCPGGSYTVDKGIEKCPSGYTSNAGAASQTDCYITCSTGYIAYPTATSCTTCSSGYYASTTKINYGSSSTCSKCPKGYACSNGVKTACAASTNTATGTYQGSEGKSSCTTATGGYYTSSSAAQTATVCPAGYACPSGKIQKCTAGTYSGTGASSCTKCTAGTYSGAGASSCTKCSAGTYSGAGASSCTKCQAGKVSSAGASSCSNCPAGTYSGAGASSCTACPAGKYSSAGSSSCTCCSAGTYSPGGRSSCTSCNSGYSSGSCASSCYKVSSGCFPGNTKVKTMFGDKPISRLKDGEILVTYNEKLKKNEFKRINKVYKYVNVDEILYTLIFDNQEQMKVTHYHKIFIIRNNEEQYIRAEDVKTNDKVMFKDGTYHKVIIIKSKEVKENVYNLWMQDNSNFYVGDSGILVHNGAEVVPIKN